MPLDDGSDRDASDADLLRAWRGGDSGAFADLVRRHQGALLRHARSLLRSQAAAEDAVQEAFLTLARTPPEPPDPSEDGAPLGLGAWLHRVTRNHCLDTMRSNARRREHEDTLRAERPTATLDPSLERIDATDTRGAIERSLAALPEDQREVLTLRLLDDRSYAEIASITGRKVGTVGWLISVGMKALARELSPLMEA
ncbi:MAG: sigma-70 family RNA polymerase sigma factor [Planctomycetota bacterium]